MQWRETTSIRPRKWKLWRVGPLHSGVATRGNAFLRRRTRRTADKQRVFGKMSRQSWWKSGRVGGDGVDRVDGGVSGAPRAAQDGGVGCDGVLPLQQPVTSDSPDGCRDVLLFMGSQHLRLFRSRRSGSVNIYRCLVDDEEKEETSEENCAI